MSIDDTTRLRLLKTYWQESESLLLSRIKRLVSNDADARDILQKAAVIAVEQFNANNIVNQQDFLRWLWARCKWISIDTITEHRKWQTLPELTYTVGPDDELTGKQLWERLVKDLPAKEKLVARLRLQGFGATEIAKKIGEKPVNIRSNWRFAKQKILASLETYMKE